MIQLLVKFMTEEKRKESTLKKHMLDVSSYLLSCRLPKNSLSVMPLPLYAGLTVEEQLQVFDPTPKYSRKVIVSTNIAEASITLEGIVYVIDVGFVKVKNDNGIVHIIYTRLFLLFRYVRIIPRLEWKLS